MGMMERLAARLGYEKRDDRADPSWGALLPGIGYPAVLGAHAAENLSSVLGCVEVIATSMASIPALIYRLDGEGNRTEALSHPLRGIVLTGVSDSMTWPDFIQHLITSALLTGNGLAEIIRAGNGKLAGFRWIPWNYVSVTYLASGRLAYDINDPVTGRTWRLLQDEAIHLRDRTDDGLVGRSRLSRAHETVQAVQASNDFARTFTKLGMAPAGIIKVPGTMTAPQREAMRTQLAARNEGSQNAGRTLVLDGGMEFTAAQISPEDAELLATRKWGVEEICRLYQVPPPLVQDYSHNTFTNSETAGRWFAMFCLSFWARKIETEFARSVFPAGGPFELELDLSGFLRGDPATRWAAHAIALQNNVLDADEVRQVEGWNPRKKETEVSGD